MPADHPETPEALPVSALRWHCDPAQFGDATAVVPAEGVIGQDRALEAIDFGLGMARPGYNIFALGPEGTGRHSTVQRSLEQRALRGAAPSDWCYVSNFKQQRNPTALELPAGRGSALKDDMARFADELRLSLRSSFESEEYRTRRQVIEEELKERQEQAVSEIEAEGQGPWRRAAAHAHGLHLRAGP